MNNNKVSKFKTILQVISYIITAILGALGGSVMQ